MVLVGDVPVDAGQDLHIVLVGREVGPGTGVVAVLVLHVLGNLFKVCQGGAGDEGIGIGNTIGGAFPAVHDGRYLGILGVHEEEELVLDDGAAEGETVSGAAVLFAGTGDLLTVHGVTLQVLVLVIYISRTLEGVGTGLGDGVHTTADEVGLTNVVGADHNLHFLNGVDGDRVAAAGEVGRQTEVVIEVGTVHGEVGQTAVGTGEAHAVTAVRGKAGNIRDAAVHRRDSGDLCVVDVGHSTGTLLGIELGSGVCNDDGSLQELTGFSDFSIQGERLGQLQGDTLVGGILVTQAGEVYLVGTAGTHTLDGIAAVGVGHGAIDGTGGLVQSHHGRADDRFAILVHHYTREGGSGHLSKGDNARKHSNECERKAFESFFHKIFRINIDT